MLDIQENVPLASFTTFKIGGNAKWYVEIAKEDDLKTAIQYAKSRKIRFVVFAGGSNVLVPDEGINGLVIRLIPGAFTFYETGVVADAGCNLLDLMKASIEKRLGGWEKLAGIPGTIGGAVRGNAGAFGVEIKDFIGNVSAVNTDTLETRVFMPQFLSFAYRDSFYKKHPEWVITSVNVQLGPKRPDEIERDINETIAERERRHLQNVQAAGSFFMNPVAPADVIALFEDEKKVKSKEGRVPAGWLIERAGLKGFSVGGAVASEQHPNYLVNAGNASSKDVLELAAKIKKDVKAQFGIELKEEAVILS